MSQEYSELLRDHGLRVTKPRLAVLDAVRSRPHTDTAGVIDAVRVALPTVSHQAVYDCLGALAEAGILRRIQPAGSVARYELRVGDNHHHLVCRSCGAVTDVDCTTGQAPCLAPGDDHGYLIDEAEVVFWGICPACSTARASAGDPA